MSFLTRVKGGGKDVAKAAFVACDRRQRCSQKMTFDARQRLSKVIKCGLSRAFTHAFDQRQRRFFVQWEEVYYIILGMEEVWKKYIGYITKDLIIY